MYAKSRKSLRCRKEKVIYLPSVRKKVGKFCFFAEYQGKTLGKVLLAECKHSANPLFAEYFFLYQVFSARHSIKRLFAEYAMDGTRQTENRSHFRGFPLCD
jgi:hypothetical protein